MYAPNEYYRPYNPRTTRERPKDRQRVPPEYVTKGRGKPPSFPLLETPPPPPSLPTHSSLATTGPLLPSKDRTECHCRLSSLLKGAIFLLILLGASGGLVFWFLNHNSAAQEIFKDIPPNVASNVNAKVPTKVATGTSVTGDINEDVQNSVKYNEVAENFPAVEGKLIISPTPRIPPTVINSSILEKIVDGSREIEIPNFDLKQNIDQKNSDPPIFEPNPEKSKEINPKLKNNDILGKSPEDILLEEEVKNVREGSLPQNDFQKEVAYDSDKTLFDDIDIKTSELSFTKDKFIDKASFLEKDNRHITIPNPSPIDNVENIDKGQINEANFNDFELDNLENGNDNIDNHNDPYEEESIPTPTTITLNENIFEQTKQDFEIEDQSTTKKSSLIGSDNELDTSDIQEKELFPSSTLFNGNSPAEKLAKTDHQILATEYFLESSLILSETSGPSLEISSSFSNPPISPLHLQKSSRLPLNDPSSISFITPVTSESPVSLTVSSASPLVTETVFGFLNFVTTVRNTVMVFTQADPGEAKVNGQTKSEEILKQTEQSSDFGLEERPTVSSFIQTQSSLKQPTVVSTIKPTAVTKTEGEENFTEIVDIPFSQEEDFVADLEESNDNIDGSEIIEQPKKRFDNFVRKDIRDESEQESLEEERQSAELSFKERLKQRFKQFRQEHKGVLNKNVAVNSQPVRNFGRSFKHEDDDSDEKREKPKFGKRTEQIRKKLAEVLKHSQRTSEKSTLERTFVPSFLRTETLSDASRIQPTIARSLFDIGPSSTRNPAVFQRKNRFNRPEIRRNLLDRVLGKAGEDIVKDEDKQVKNKDEGESTEAENDIIVVPAKSIQPSNTKTNTILNDQVPAAPIFNASPLESDTNNINLQSSMHENQNAEESLFPTPLIQIVEPEIQISTSVSKEIPFPSIKQNNHESTLEVATVVPKDQLDTYLEIATIRSPYTFDVDKDQKSTRYITVTRTFTSDILLTPRIDLAEKQTIEQSVSINSESSNYLESTLHISTVFPDNIDSSYIEVATIRSPYSFSVEDEVESTRFITVTRTFTSDFANLESTNIETPSAFDFLDLNLDSPTFETVTEILTSQEVIVKTSVVPVVVDEDFTSLQTLTQSFTVTSLVTALKTLTASRPSNFAPSASFIDIDREFDNQESINRETFLPIELGFANQNRIKIEDIKFAKESTEEHFPLLDPSFAINPSQSIISQFNAISVRSTPTPPLTPNSISTVSPPIFQNILSPAQLQYIQLLQERLSGIKPQVVTMSEEVLRTETEYATNTIKIIQGDTEFETTLLKPIGLTTITDYKFLTTTLPPQLSSLPPVPTNLPPINQLSLGFAPSYTTVTSAVTHSTVITETDTQEYKIIFRARPITTTVLSTKVVSTVLTSFVTQTLTVPPIIGGILG